MTILQWNTNFSSGSYSTDLVNLLKLEENAVLADPNSSPSQISKQLKPYYDGSIAIGYGFDLLVHSDAEINSFLADIGLGPLSTQDAQLLDANRNTSSASTLKQVAAQLSLNLGSEANAANLLTDYINKIAEKNVDRFLSANGLSMPPSMERIALVSLAYNTSALLGSGLAAALKLSNPNDARAEAWYQIRYQSNRDMQHASRRYRESALFGLYDSSYVPGITPMSDDMARAIYRMYTQHANTMKAYDSKYGSLSDLSTQLQPAETYLIQQYGQGNSFDALNIFVGDTPATRSVVLSGDTINRSSDSAGDLIIGGIGNDTLIGSAAGNDLLVAGTGNDALYGGTGNDTLVSGNGIDVLNGGAGNNKYIINSSAANSGTLPQPQSAIIEDGTGQGTIWANGVQLTGSTADATSSGNTFVWTEGNLTYTFTPNAGQSGIGTMQISGAGEPITIDNFDLSKAQTDTANGYLGIKFKEQLSVLAGTDTSPANAYTQSSQTADVPVGNTKTFTLYASAASSTAQTIQLALAGGNATNLAISTGANLLSFANGSVQLTLPAGQDQATFTLVDLTNTNQIDTATLTASLNNANGTVTSNTLAITFEQPGTGTSSVTPDHVINGELNPVQYHDTAGNLYYQLDSLGNLVTDGSVAAHFNDTLWGSAGNDQINAGGGTNYISGMGGNDTINAGAGNDVIVSGDIFTGGWTPANLNFYPGNSTGLYNTTTYGNYNGNGNDLINAGGGQDIILAGNGNNRIYANTQVDLAQALANQKTAAATNQQGDLIAVGDGTNTLVGSNGNDAIFTGTGHNTLVLGNGNNTLEGGVEVNAVAQGWNITTEANGNLLFNGVDASVGGGGVNPAPATYHGSIWQGAAVGGGNDTIFGGTGDSTYFLSNGDNWLDAGGGNDAIHAGTGHNTLYGGSGNDTINGGGGNNYINLESGNDTIVLFGGNNTVVGGAGDNVIVSGDIANWNTSETLANNSIYGGSGNTVIYGSGGHDTLLSGSASGTNKSTTIYAGDGNEYIVGGNGNDMLYGGAGSDTLYAGDGNTSIQLSSNASETSTVYGGNGVDTITGGAGTDVISAGDGGTAANATQVHAGSGTSTLYGGAGYDQLYGGSGTDTLVAGTGTSTLQGGSGTEVMYGSIGNATLIAGTGNDTLYGGTGTDVLQGSSGNTVFVAGTGNETITGGTGHNTYQFNAGFGTVELGNTRSADTFGFGAGVSLADLTVSAALGSDGNPALLIESSGGGQLTLDNGLNGALSQFAFANGTLLSLNQLMAQASTTPATVAGTSGNVVFSASGNDTLVGGTGNDTIYGWNGGNTLIAGSGTQTLYSETGNDLVSGGSGNDTLVSAAGHDTLVGGTGDTTFVVNGTTDVIQAQSTGSNTNTVKSSVSYVAPANVQNLTGSGSGDLTLTGNSLNNTLTANSGNDTLIAGSGIATMIGGTGNDTFVVNNSADVVQAQSTGSNVNTVLTSVDYVAPANVPNLTGSGSANITLIGNSLNDVITANSGNDTLIAGSGIATLIGGTGNDTFVVNNPADVINAKAGGINTVLTSVSYVAPANVKNLTGTGSANLTLTGNNLNNVITANSGNDTLDGGAGNDTLYGGAGLDTFFMGYGMGSDTVIDTSVQGGIVQLKPGLALSDLLATQRGNDLLLQINGSTTESMRIRGYYSNPQTAWTIQDAAGNAAAPQALLDATAALHQSAIATAESNFIAHAKGELTSSLLASGYLMQADGTLYQPYQMPHIGRIVTTQSGQETITDRNADGTVAGSQTSSFSRSSISDTTAYSYSPYNWNYGINFSDRTASINVVNSTSNAPVVYADPYSTGSQDYYTRWLQMNWTSAPATSSPYHNSTTIPYIYWEPIPIKLPDGSFVYVSLGPFRGTETTSDVGITTQTAITGTVIGVLSDPGSLVTTGTTPQAVQAQYDSLRAAYEIQTIDVGAGDHTVYAGSNTLVNSSTGNDTIYNAGFAYGGSGNDTMIGGGTLMAGTGEDLLINGKTMVAGSGSDQMFAGSGKATFQIDPATAGTDLIGGAGDSSQFLDAFYQSMGINYWSQRYEHGGQYFYLAGGGKFLRYNYVDEQGASDVAAAHWGLTLTQALDQERLHFVEPLPVIVKIGHDYEPSPYYATANVPVVTLSANDYQALAPYYAQGILPAHDVEFGQGVLPSDLHLSWGQTVGSIRGLSADPQLRYTTLNLSWGANHPSIRVMIPHSDDPLGSGVSGFTFADGTTLSMAQMIALAPPAPSFDPQRVFSFESGMGAQTLPAGVSSIQFAAGIAPAGVSVTQNSQGNFLISYNNGASSLVIPAQSAVAAPMGASFANGTTWQFVNAAGNPYTYSAGSGVVYLINAPGNGSVQFGTGITSGMITLGLGSLMLRVGNNGDVLHIEGFNPADALHSGEIQTFKFADGTTLSYSQLLARGFDIYGTTGNETLSGTNLDNRIYAGSGNDTLIGTGANDTLVAGAGVDTMIGGTGNETFVVNNVDDVVQAQAGGINTIQTSVSYTTSAHVQNLTGTGSADITLTGNDLADVIIANSGNDTLVAGSGVATLIGGAGNDTFVVNNVDDVVQAQAGGVNTIQTSVSYTASVNVQNLTGTGNADIVLTGNDLNDVITANGGNDTLIAGTGVATMIGGAGSDTFAVNNAGDVVVAQTSGINTVLTSVDYVAPANVQNITGIGSAGLILTGNNLGNVITANDAGDTLIAGTGVATMIGGAGNDTFVVDNPGDLVIEQPNAGIDTILSSVSYVLPANVENLTLTGAANLTATGNDLANVLIANSGNDTLIAGSGVATLIGGAGNDTFVVNNIDDVVQAQPGGVNTLQTSVSYTASANVQNLTGTGNADLTLTGNDLNNVITANSGNDTLIAGSGIDTLIGGAGNDTFVVNNVDDVVQAQSSGMNTIQTSVSYTASANVQNLTGNGVADLTLTGNNLNGVITANSGNDTLITGSGIDTLIGGTGNDTFVVNNVNDVVQAQSGGVNTIQTSVSYTASANVQNLTGAGNADIALTGNDLNNIITANSGNDTLIAGSGVATLIGGSGNDTFVVNNINDVVQALTGGLDTILSSVNYVLPANVQNLTGTGSANLTLTGNSLNNVITANSGDDTLIGGGGNDTLVAGTGNDTLIGGSGNDTYVYSQGDGLDTVIDPGGNNTVQLGAGLSLQNAVIRLTTANGSPYPVWIGDDSRWRGEADDDDGGDDEHNKPRTLNAHLRVLDAHGVEQSNQGIDFTVTVDRAGHFSSPIQRFQFADGSVNSFYDMLVKRDTIHAQKIVGPVITGRNDDVVYAGARNTGIWLGSGNDTVYASHAGTKAYGGGGNDYFVGAGGSDTFVGGWGIDVLQGGRGNDTLSDPYGPGALLGGRGNDTITGGAGNDFLAGGKGNDTLATGATRNVIAFNAGDGQDTVLASPGAANILSLGGEIEYGDLKFAKKGNDLILNIGKRDAITFQDWYAAAANHDFVTLQVLEVASEDYHKRSSDPLRNNKIETFDLTKLVTQFDAARAATPGLSSWSLMNGLLNAHLAGSDTAALGGDLAYYYGVRGSLSGMDLTAAQAALKDTQFGSTAQSVHPWPSVSHGTTPMK